MFIDNQQKDFSVVAKELVQKGVLKTYLSYVPTFVLGRFFVFFANFIDTLLLAYLLGATALSVLSVVYPLYLCIQFSLSLFDGLHIYLSNCFGEKDKKKVQTVFTLIFFLMLIATVILTILYFNSYNIINFLVKDSLNSSDIVYFGQQYLNGIMWGLFALIAFPSFSYIVSIDGSKYLPILAYLLTLISNIFLDIILIKHYSYFGAGLATSISSFIGLIVLLTHFLKKNNVYKLLFTFDFSNISFKKIFTLTCPKLSYDAGKLLSTTVLTYLGFNGFKENFGIVNNIYYLVHQFIYVATFGLADASKPLLGVAYGQKDYITLHKILHAMYIVILIPVISICLFSFIFPQFYPLLMTLNVSDEAFLPTCTAIRLLAISSTIFAISFVYRIYYGQIGHEKFISILSILEPTVFIIPFYYLLCGVENTYGFWLSNIFKEIISFIILFIFHIYQNKKLSKNYYCNN